MRRLVTTNRTTTSMDQSDITYIIELLNDAISEKDWDKIEEARETLKEFLDTGDSFEEE